MAGKSMEMSWAVSDQLSNNVIPVTGDRGVDGLFGRSVSAERGNIGAGYRQSR
jgi:hypothetical protein